MADTNNIAKNGGVTKSNPLRPKFSPGPVFITPGVRERVPVKEAAAAFLRHIQGDWGEVCEEDREENELSLREGFRLVSVYCSDAGERFWIITEADRSATTLLLPEEY